MESEFVSGMGPTVDDVEGWDGEDIGRLYACKFGQVLVERNALFSCTSLSDSNGYAKNSVSTKLSFVRSAIELDQEVVNLLLLSDGEARLDQSRSDGVVHVCNGLENT